MNKGIDKKVVNFVEIGNKFNISRQTASKKFAQLKELDLIKEVEGRNDIYELTILDRDIATLVPYDILRIMTNTLSEKSISTYIYFLNRYYANSCKSFIFTID